MQPLLKKTRCKRDVDNCKFRTNGRNFDVAVPIPRFETERRNGGVTKVQGLFKALFAEVRTYLFHDTAQC